MASIIRVKRSTGTTAPSTLNYGELAVTIGGGTQANNGERLFVGDSSSNPTIVGGKYFTDLLDHTHGTLTASSAVIVDSSSKIDVWNVDNLRLDGNALTSTDVDGHITITPNGTGRVQFLDNDEVQFGTSDDIRLSYDTAKDALFFERGDAGATADIRIADDTHFQFGTDNDARIYYDEASSDRLQVEGASWTYAGSVQQVSISTNTTSSNTTSGALVVTGGVGVGGNLNIGGDIDIDGQTELDDLNVSGVSTFAGAADFNGDIDVDGHTELDNLNVSGVSTFAGAADFNGDIDVDGHTELDNLNVSGVSTFASAVDINADIDIDGHTELDNLNVSGVSTFASAVDINDNLDVDGHTELDNLNVAGVSTFQQPATFNSGISVTGEIVIDSVGISSNTISTKSGSGNILYIDPYPDGLSNEGTVVIKGDLQVDGTTTTVNSSSVSVNEAILNLGDVTSQRTVMETVQTGVSTVRFDSVVGINTGDLIQGSTSLPNSGVTTVASYDTVNKIVTFEGTTSAGIAITTQLTITHAFDTNTDRGISFDYNTSSGSSNNKTGFFGFDDTNSKWTFVPDATITNSVVSGTKGYLDIKGIFYQSGDFSTHGIVYFDNTGLQTSTSAPSAATFTSTQVLTAVTEIDIVLDSATHSFTQGDQVTQANNSAAYGVVKTTTSSSANVTLIGVQGTFDTTNDLIVEGVNISKNPSSVTTTYTSKPTWTTTLDGGTF